MATKRENYMILADIVSKSDYEDKAEMVEFVNHEIELLDRKASKTSASKAKTAEENSVRMDKVYEALASVNRPIRISDLQKEVPEMLEYSLPRLTYLLGVLLEKGVVVRTADKRNVLWSIAE